MLWVMIEDVQHLLYEEQLSSVRLFSLEKDRTWKGYDNSQTVSGTESWEQSLTPSLCLPVQEEEAVNEGDRFKLKRNEAGSSYNR